MLDLPGKIMHVFTIIKQIQELSFMQILTTHQQSLSEVYNRLKIKSMVGIDNWYCKVLKQNNEIYVYTGIEIKTNET